MEKSAKRFLSIGCERVMEADIGTSAAVVAYYLFLSIFPLLLTVGNVLPYLAIDPNLVLPYMQELMPVEIYQQLEPLIVSLLTKSSASLLSFSALATLWSASKSVNALRRAMNKAYGVDDRRNFLVKKIVSFLMMVLLIVALVATILILGLSQTVVDWLSENFKISTEWFETFTALKWPTVALGLLVTMLIIYRLLPNAKIHFKNVWVGALLTTGGWLLLSQAFSLYLHYFSSSMASYQIIGSVIVMMLWLNIAAYIIIIGGVLNATLTEFINGERIPQRRLEDKKKNNS